MELNQVSPRRLAPGYSYGGCLEDILPPASFGPVVTNDGESCDQFWMREALRESMKGIGLANPNPSVGCIIVKDGREIARGHTQAYGGKHAERMAIESVMDQSLLAGATAYVTLEPCSHQGHQPPCAELLAQSPIERIVVARQDPDVRVCGRGIERLKSCGKRISIGILSDEVSAWNSPFFATRERATPFFALKWAQTLDGQLADDSGRSQWISGPCARTYTHWLRQKYDAILIGAGTFAEDLSSLTVRDCAPIRRQPLKLIFDPNDRLLNSSLERREKFIARAESADSPYLVLSKTAGGSLYAERLGPNFVPVLIEGTNLRDQLLPALASEQVHKQLGKPLQSVFVEGGPRLLTEMVRSRLGDVAHVFVSPLITGGQSNRIFTHRTLLESSRWQNVSIHSMGDDVLMEFLCSRS